MKRLSVPATALFVVCAFAGCKKVTSPSDNEPSPSYEESNQIPWSGAPITTPGCANAVHTWTWTITIKENNGASGLTIEYLDSKLDGVAQPRQTLNTKLGANATVVIPRAVCHGDGVQHTVEETLVSSVKGQPNTFGNTITLLARPR